jgi:hypothetical protein
MKLIHTRLVVIDLIENGEQSINFNRRIKEWMDQWTVENNFNQYVLTPEQHANNVHKVEWAEHFLSSMRNAIGYTLKDYDFSDDFVFMWYEENITAGTGFSNSELSCHATNSGKVLLRDMIDAPQKKNTIE